MPSEGFLRDNPFHLTDRQLAFLNEYLIDFKISRAARVMGMNPEVCWKWANKDKNFQAAIDAYLEKRRRENEELVLMTLNELKEVMLSDIRDYVSWTGRNRITLKASKDLKSSKAIKGIEKTKAGVKLILHDKVKSIELMMTGLGMMKRPAGERIVEAPADDANGEQKMSLLEALNRAHEERKNLPRITDGLVEVAPAEDKKEGNDVQKG